MRQAHGRARPRHRAGELRGRHGGLRLVLARRAPRADALGSLRGEGGGGPRVQLGHGWGRGGDVWPLRPGAGILRLGLILAGCAGPGEAERYRAALAATDWGEARKLCDSLDGPDRPDCLLAAMERLG